MFTHPFQVVLLLATMTGAIALPVVVGLPMTDRYGLWPFAVTTVASVTIALVALHLWIIPLATWLHLAVFRRTIVAFEEARELSPLFMPNRLGSWYPMREIAEMPPAHRVPHMRAFLAAARADGIIRQPGATAAAPCRHIGA